VIDILEEDKGRSNISTEWPATQFQATKHSEIPKNPGAFQSKRLHSSYLASRATQLKDLTNACIGSSSLNMLLSI